MKVEIILSQEDEEPRVQIYTKTMNEELSQLVELLMKQEVAKPSNIIGLLDDIYYFEANGNTIIAVHNDNRYKIGMRLYEVERVVPTQQFMRISKSIIININKIYTIERSFGTPSLITLQNNKGTVLASSQYVKQLKKQLTGI